MKETGEFTLPYDLMQRLLAAGVEDEESLQAALEADPGLQADYEHWLVGITLTRFAQTEDAQELQALVQQVPILLEEPVMAAIQQAINQAVSVGDQKNAEALAVRLQVLQSIKAQHESTQSALAQALVLFVQAPDEEAARQVYAAHREVLGSEMAVRVMEGRNQAEDTVVTQELNARRQLLLDLNAQE